MTTKKGSQSDALNNAAADNTTALNPIVGIQPEELIRAFGVVLRESARQPSVFQKHMTNHLRDMLDVLSGKSEFAPEPKDKRFKDTAWETNPFYRVGLQS
jgi:polyhydroxyalkanoate synthase subunit PhaC